MRKSTILLLEIFFLALTGRESQGKGMDSDFTVCFAGDINLDENIDIK